MQYSLYEEIPYQDPLTLFHVFSAQQGAIFLESARLMEGCGRYSFIAVDPFYVMRCKNQDSDDPFVLLRNELQRFPLAFHPDLPPFQGGVAGYFSYDLCQHLEKISLASDDMEFPHLLLGFYDVVIAFDELLKRAWIFSSGYPVQSIHQREQRAQQRLDKFKQILTAVPAMPSCSSILISAETIHSNFTRTNYENAVNKVIDYILAGDIFEANISQRFKTTLQEGLTAFDLYRRLRQRNAAPFAAYLYFNDTVIVSASPERFLKLTGKQVETRPIKGTRARSQNVLEDEQLANELLRSEKDRAENVMIVDLLRNDLSRVCEDHSVQVPQLCGLESYATVHHLVSVVKGKLRQECDVIDLLRASFPGGSITGAPKIRAMDIIAEIEMIQRGPYCGSVGYIGFNGDFDSSITIRTYAIRNGIVTFQAGGAIVADSDPAGEYEETITKAKALHDTLTQLLP